VKHTHTTKTEKGSVTIGVTITVKASPPDPERVEKILSELNAAAEHVIAAIELAKRRPT
jgi:hypothetical protein